jgi:hypothetical protein
VASSPSGVAQPAGTSLRPRHGCGTINDKRLLTAARSTITAKIDRSWFVQVKAAFGWSDAARLAVRPAGFEPATFGLEVRRSIR